MILWNAVRMALSQLARAPLRSSLTTLGVLIGVAAVIAMVALGRGAAARVAHDLSSLGRNLLFVVPGTPGHGGAARVAAPPFNAADLRAVRQLPGVAAVAPVSTTGVVAVHGGSNWRTMLTGTDDNYLQVMSWTLESGRGFEDTELRSGASVCLIGQTVREELFGDLDPVGATLRVGNVSLRVIGLLAPKGQSTFGQDQDDFILVPLATMQRRFTGGTDVGAMFVSAQDTGETAQLQADLEALMSERRRVAPGELPDFFVRDMKEVADMLSGVTGVLTSVLAAIAAVSLLVGGIGIMNIMLVAVSERTREIGIRMAIGALGRDVMMQFLTEAVTLSVLGGVAGIALGLVGSWVVTRRLGLPLVIDGTLIAMPFGFAVLVGGVFGFFPARKAARMDPIEALRHE